MKQQKTYFYKYGVRDEIWIERTRRRRQGECEGGEGEQEAWPPKDRSVQETPVTCPDLPALAPPLIFFLVVFLPRGG